MRTPDPRIWAVGDAVEVPDVMIGQDTVFPLAGPANRQGRVAATGASEKGLRRAGAANFKTVYLHPGHHAGYYPGARPIT